MVVGYMSNDLFDFVKGAAKKKSREPFKKSRNLLGDGHWTVVKNQNDNISENPLKLAIVSENPSTVLSVNLLPNVTIGLTHLLIVGKVQISYSDNVMLQKLKYLRVEKVGLLCFEELLSIITKFPSSLDRLDIVNCEYGVYNNLFKSKYKSVLGNVSDLMLNGDYVDDELVEKIAMYKRDVKMKKLRYLDLSFSKVSAFCEGLESLLYLNLRLCTGINDNSVKTISENMPELRGLVLQATSITDTGLKIICHSKNWNLEMLDISINSSVTDEGLSFIANNMPNLKRLNLFSCTAITGSGIREIARMMSTLQILDISHCKNIEEDDVNHIKEELRSLKLVDKMRINRDRKQRDKNRYLERDRNRTQKHRYYNTP